MRHMLAFAAILLVPIGTSSVMAQTVVPVQFARGMTSSTVDSSIRGTAYTDYRVIVGKGQYLSVTLRPTGGSPYFNVMEPNSNGAAIYNSSMGEQRFAGTTAQNGAYIIRVYQLRATGRRGETARFQLTVSVTSGGGVATQLPGSQGGVATQLPGSQGGVATQLPGDALVPGTSYNATTTIPCRIRAGAAMSSCRAGVIRRRSTATVHVDTPGGGERTILYRGIVPVASDGDSRIGVQRNRDVGIVRIGDAEIYEVPDVLITGG